MPALAALLARTAAVAAVSVSTLAFTAPTVSAQEIDQDNMKFVPHEEVACMTDQPDVCATYRCDITGDCARVSDWREVADRQTYRGYRSFSGYDRSQSRYRCDESGDNCAWYRCDALSEHCRRTSDWDRRAAPPEL